MACDGSVWLQNYYLVLSADNAIGSLQDINTVRDLQKPNASLGSKSGQAAYPGCDGKRLTPTLFQTDEEHKLKHLLSDTE